MKISDLDFEYPEDLVATERVQPSRVLLAGRPPGATSQGSPDSLSEVSLETRPDGVCEITRSELLELFKPGDLWVVNETKVLKRRVFTKEGLEILFIRPLAEPPRGAETLGFTDWEVLCPSSRWKQGTRQTVGSVSFELIERGRPQKLRASEPLHDDFFEMAGELPLPPYIQKARGERHTRTEDSHEYQSLWAKTGGSLAAPTASFHFDQTFVDALKLRGVEIATVTLHVGLGTFLPVTVDHLDDHVMHAEFAEIPAVTQEKIKKAKAAGGRVIAVGTTVTRTLEAMALGHFGKSSQNDSADEARGDLRGETSLLIRPGHEWRVVDVLLTNFHQPRSTLFALVAAFSSLEHARTVYAWAIERKFRLFSYGDLSVWFKRTYK